MSADFQDELDIEEGRPHAEMEPGESSGMAIWSVLGILVVAAAIGFVVYDGLKSETYFYTVDQAISQGTDLPGQRVRVKGIVEPGSIEGKDGHLGRKLRIAENGRSLAVTYNKAMPDTFEENREVVVQGEVDEEMTIVADEVLVKCPSRYEGNPPTATEQPQASL
jgi:cytochrome c-type biogenesis protein CcmE